MIPATAPAGSKCTHSTSSSRRAAYDADVPRLDEDVRQQMADARRRTNLVEHDAGSVTGSAVGPTHRPPSSAPRPGCFAIGGSLRSIRPPLGKLLKGQHARSLGGQVRLTACRAERSRAAVPQRPMRPCHAGHALLDAGRAGQSGCPRRTVPRASDAIVSWLQGPPWRASSRAARISARDWLVTRFDTRSRRGVKRGGRSPHATVDVQPPADTAYLAWATGRTTRFTTTGR